MMLSGLLTLVIVGSGSPYNVDPFTSAAASFSLLGVVGFSEALVKPTLRTTPRCKFDVTQDRCESSELNSIDESVLGNNSTEWRLVSDLGMYGAVALPLVATLLDVGLSGSANFAQDAARDILVITEAVAVTTFATHLLKYAVQRPRPAMYQSGSSRSFEQNVSFPSGHTSAAAAGFTAYAMTFALRHADSGWRYVVGLGAGLATAAVAYGRVAGGRHFYSDVLAGALLGAGCGAVIPLMHRKETEAQGVVVQPTGVQLSWVY